MWKIQLPSGEYLQTPPDFALSFELQNQVFSTGSTDVLPGSFSFPVETTLTPKMQQQLGHPQKVDNAKPVYEIPGVWVYCEGVAMFFGTLKINSTTRTRCRVTILSTPLAKLKTVNLGELDLGGTRSTGPMFFHVFMKATAQNPENYDFCFFPVESPNCNSFPDVDGDPDPVADQCFQNYYTQLGSQEFSEASGGCTPFIRLDYLLSRIFAVENTGFGFENGWQVNEELRRLYVYNNYDCRVLNVLGVPSLPIQFKLNPHVPNIKCTDFIKKVVAQHCLGLFTNLFSFKIRLLALSDVLSRAAAADWTEYAIGEPQVDPPSNPVNTFNYEETGDALPADFPAPYDLETFATLDEYSAFPVAEGFYFVESTGQFVKKEAFKDNKYKQFQGVKVAESGEPYQAGMECMHSYERYHRSQVEVSRFHKIVEDSETRYERQVVDPPVALMLYRGMQTVAGDGVEDAGVIPYASNHVYVPGSGSPASRNQITATGATAVDSERSLNWFGEHGLYNVAHRQWQEMLRGGKPITQSFALPVAVLTAFGFEDKIRLGNMECFVKKLRVGKALGKGRVQVEASMVTTV